MIARLLCFFGLHDWDGHTEPEYPTPRCRRCFRWHHRKPVAVLKTLKSEQMNANEALVKGFRVYCLDCFTVYRTIPTRQYEDGHGGRQLEMCRCGCDLFCLLANYDAKRR